MSFVHQLLYQLDWAAVSTVTLAAITANYAHSTRQLLRATARQAAAAERTLEVLISERNRQLRQAQSPMAAAIREGRIVAERWLSLDFDAMRYSNVWPDSRDLELPELPQLVQRARSLHFPLAEALTAVEQAIINTRTAIDDMSAAGDDEAFFNGKNAVFHEIQTLVTAWHAAEAAMAEWQ